MIQLSIDREYADLSTDQLNELMTSIDGIVYARVSTLGQAKHGYSIESQIERSVKLAAERYGIPEERLLVIVDGGEMGDDPYRPAINQVLYLIEQGIGTKVIMLHPDRLARDLKLQLIITERLWSAGCDVQFVEMDLDRNNPESMLLYNIQGAISQYNKAKILANSKRGRKTKALNGKIPGMRRLYGYKFDKVNDTLVINEEERDVYLMMVDWVLNGKDGRAINFTSVAKELSLLGIPGPEGDKWYQGTVSRMLKNEVYTGKYKHGKTEYKQSAGQVTVVKKPREDWIEIKVPAIIDEDTFERLQKKVGAFATKNRGARPKVPYLLKGIARCGRCGGAVHAGAPSRSKSTGEILYHYYVCTNKTRKVFEVGTGREVHACRGRNWRKDVVEQYVWNYMKECLSHPDEVLKRIWDEKSDSDHVKVLHEKLERVRKALEEKDTERKQLLKQNLKGYLSDEELEEQISPLLKDIRELNESVELIQQAIKTSEINREELNEIHSVIESFKAYIKDGISEEEKKRLIELMVSQVVLHEDHIEIYTTWGSGLEETAATTTYVSNNLNDGQRYGGP